MILLTIFILLILGFSIVSAPIERSPVTAPMIFAAAGVCMLLLMPNLQARESSLTLFLVLAEGGLVLLLFTDASRTSLQFLKSIRNLATRLLSIGMLLTILLGAAAALLCFPGLTIWEAGILAAILAPTDAGLGQVIVTNERVPMRIRQALNVEAGLNDGLSVPFMLFFMALASPAEGYSFLSRFMMEQLGYGMLVGGAIGFAGGWLLRAANDRGWVLPSWLPLGVVTLPLLCGIVSAHVAASMFIAAFVAGLAVQIRFKEAGRHAVEFAEEWGQLFNLSVFFIFGALVARDWEQFTIAHVGYALLSLTVVRMLPVAIALWGTRMSAATVLFMGWFGPRGLASIVLALVYLEHTNRNVPPDIRLATMLTVFLSIFAHGATAMPGIRLYLRKLQALPENAPEAAPLSSGTPALPTTQTH